MIIIQEYEWYWSIIFNNYYVYVCITRRGVTCPHLMETFEIKVWAEGSDHPECHNKNSCLCQFRM